MSPLKFIMTSKEVEFNIDLNINRNKGIEKIKELIDKEIKLENSDNDYRLIGSLTNDKQGETLTLIVERQNGNSRFDVMKGIFKISTGESFTLIGHIENKCKIYGQLGIIIFLIGLSFYIVPKINPDEFLYFLIYPAIIIWLITDIYLRPTKALNFLKRKILEIDKLS